MRATALGPPLEQRQIEAVAAAGEAAPRRYDQPDHLDDADRADREVVAPQPQDDGAERRRERADEQRGDAPGQHHRHACPLRQRAGIAAEPEERRGRERRIAGEAADEIPRQRQRREHRDRDRQADDVVARPQRRRRQQRAPRGRTGRTAAGASSLVALDAGQAGRPDHEQHQHQQEADRQRMLRPEELAGEALDDAEHDAADQRARHAAEAADDADHERLAEIRAAEIGGDRIHHREDRAGGARHQRADAEGDGVDAIDPDAHQRGRRAVHAHGDDRAADARPPHDEIEQAGQHQRQQPCRATDRPG